MTDAGRPVVAVVQARMGSTRFPGKTLADLAGRPMLHRVMRRLHRATRLDQVVLATTTSPVDDRMVREATEQGWHVVRGSEDDVLDRYHQAAEATGAATVVRITADCPVIDPGVVDHIVATLLADDGIDYASNTLPPRTFPRGLDTEVLRRSAIDAAWAEATQPAEREHVTPFLHHHPYRFRLVPVTTAPDRSDVRWTVDTPDDLAAVTGLYEHFDGDDAFTWHQALAAWDAHPEWAARNAHVEQKPVS